MSRAIDECPVRGCGAFVPGVDPEEVYEGTDYECLSGHRLFSVVGGDGVASMEPVRFPGGRVQPRIVRKRGAR